MCVFTRQRGPSRSAPDQVHLNQPFASKDSLSAPDLKPLAKHPLRWHPGMRQRDSRVR